MRRILIVLIFLAGQAQAGAWMREPGDVFISPTYTTEEVRGRSKENTYAGIYAEWGVTPSLTLGADLGTPGSGDPTGVFFARIPLVETPQGIRAAAEIGIGVRDGPGSSKGFLRPSLSLGYGFGSRYGNGWLALDLQTEIDRDSAFRNYKADLTLGMSFTSHIKAMLQLHHESLDGVEQNTLVPSIVWRTRDRQHVQLGLLFGRGGRRAKGLKVSLWQEF